VSGILARSAVYSIINAERLKTNSLSWEDHFCERQTLLFLYRPNKPAAVVQDNESTS
jgi:hypothetical protein